MTSLTDLQHFAEGLRVVEGGAVPAAVAELILTLIERQPGAVTHHVQDALRVATLLQHAHAH